MHTEILIVGAGAAGLMAARTLAQAGKKVLVLEARARLGGRIHTFRENGFSGPAEAGAEFLHGDVAQTQQLLHATGTPTYPTGGITYEVTQGVVHESAEFLPEMPLLLEKLHALPHDLPLAEFLTQAFPAEEHRTLRNTVTRFAEGYDAADARRASSFALRDEWSGGGAEDSPRPEGGYGAVVAQLHREVEAAGGQVRLNSVVEKIIWHPHHVTLHCTDGCQYHATRALLTMPLGVLQAEAGSPGYFHLEPELPEHRAAATALGFGSVIKLLLEFNNPFWLLPRRRCSGPCPT
ncbi:flavin monoamine oxidase family protein [Hymenobacter sp. AT01-02]|uniref:flavin monoamine oxidase family protein n=1 Tax=Hymenobacter sp. AT01-02 TaxID=1571877 RepID=UPI000697E624|nr:NAD(P)/FAD-dependent oxidoreductase [Hymenobacter sp. AT01-02]